MQAPIPYTGCILIILSSPSLTVSKWLGKQLWPNRPPLLLLIQALFARDSDVCIRGHRSSRCTHTDRPLFEIRKKGRPITQCNHCRDLRKVKQVHVRCGCRKEAGWTGKRNGEHGASYSSRICKVTHPSNSHYLGKSKNATGPIFDEDYTECNCDETGICPCAVPRNESSSLHTLHSPSSPHTIDCHGPTGGRPASSQPSCCPSQPETPINCQCNSPLSSLNSTDQTLLSSMSELPDGGRRRRNSAPPACACPVVQSPYIHAAASSSTHSCCNQPASTRLPPNLTDPTSFPDVVYSPSNSYTPSYADPVFQFDPLFNASQPVNPSHGALRAESSGQAPRFAPYPNHSRSQSMHSSVLQPQQQYLFHPPTSHAQTNPSDTAAPQSMDLVTPLTQRTNPATLEEFFAPIPTRTSPGVRNSINRDKRHTPPSSGTVFAAPIEPVISNCSCSGSCSCVLCSGSNLDTVLMGTTLGTEPDNCQRCSDCFDCASLLNDLPQLEPLRDASVAALSTLQTVPAPQLGMQSQTDVQPQFDINPPSALQLEQHTDVPPSWTAAPDPDMLSLPPSNPLFAPSEAELTNSAWSDYLLSVPIDKLWPVNGNSNQLAPTQAESGEASVTHNLDFNGPVDGAYHDASKISYRFPTK